MVCLVLRLPLFSRQINPIYRNLLFDHLGYIYIIVEKRAHRPYISFTLLQASIKKNTYECCGSEQ
jgi:hypothetical protein